MFKNNNISNKKSNILLSKYKLIKKISKGSCGTVHLAKCIDGQNIVVVKIISKKITHIKSKIQRDAEIPKLLNHKNIIKIIDFMEDDKYAYIIYPYNTGSKPLSKFKHSELNFKNHKNLVSMINILCQIADAIEYMHSQSIIHRDIKPDNIIVYHDNNETNQNLSVIIIDFDLAHVINDPKYPLRKGLIGTIDYIAPEIINRENNICYPLTDIYSFGIIMYFIFNRKKVPYDGVSISQIINNIINNQPIPSNSGIEVIDKLIMTTIDKNQLKRPTISEIKICLKKLIISDQP